MDTNDLVKLLPPGYEQACFDKKAITRKRTIKNHLDLLRLILFYLSGNKSLIDVTHFALLSGIGKISDVAFMKKVHTMYGYQKELCKALYRNGTSIQAIREYMGCFTDETVKKYIGWVDEEV